ncbi:hypothetical protein C8J56DRAFT_771417 [Mycena floridula]|nr:hypothetical protein C8J56DRAFT_771417 [Mycena floridula]
MVDQFTDVFLGFERDCKRGVFGRVKHYYGVIEAQNRGSLHLHILIWLEGVLSPLEIQKHCANDVEFKSRLFEWLENVFVHNLPPNTQPIDGSQKEIKRCIMGRPPHPESGTFDEEWVQYLREVLEASGHIHTHSDTCYKNISKSIRSLSDADRDKFCRFKYPHTVIEFTFIDNDGRIHYKRLDGRIVGYNPTISGSFQCNTDGKFIGSGLLGAAMCIYVTNYTAKASLDSSVIASALAAAMESLHRSEKESPISSEDEHCRILLLKTLNQINGRRELSGQQVASSLLGFSNHISDARFTVIYWSKLLNWLSPEHFKPRYPANHSADTSCVEKATDERYVSRIFLLSLNTDILIYY